MFNRIKEYLDTLWAWFLKEKARRSLIGRYEYMLQNNVILEEFDTYRILEFQESQRNGDLVKIQKENEQMQVLLDFLKNMNKIKKNKSNF